MQTMVSSRQPNAYKLKSQSPVRNGMNEMKFIPFTPADQGRGRGRGDGGGEEIDGSPHHTRLDPGVQNKIWWQMKISNLSLCNLTIIINNEFMKLTK